MKTKKFFKGDRVRSILPGKPYTYRVVGGGYGYLFVVTEGTVYSRYPVRARFLKAA